MLPFGLFLIGTSCFSADTVPLPAAHSLLSLMFHDLTPHPLRSLFATIFSRPQLLSLRQRKLGASLCGAARSSFDQH